MIARDEEALALRVPDREGEHAAQLREHRRIEFAIGMQQHLGVAVGAKARAARDELVAQLPEVVDLAIEDDGERAVLGRHRLVAQRQVDHREPAEAEAEAARAMEPFLVGAAMREPARHAHEHVVGDGRGREVARDAAHG